jgi:hypothetical protein
MDNNETKKGESRPAEALKRDWEQTKHDFDKDKGKDLNQDVGDTVGQAVGKKPIPDPQTPTK